MSYNLIIVLLLVMLPLNALIVFFSYRQGIKDGRTLNSEEKPLEPIFTPIKQEVKQNDEIKRLNTIMNNINNYKGNSLGQREVK